MEQRAVSFCGLVSPSGVVGLWPTVYTRIRNPGHHCQDLERSEGILDPVRGGQQGLEGTDTSDNGAAWPAGSETLPLRAGGGLVCHSSNLCKGD